MRSSPYYTEVTARLAALAAVLSASFVVLPAVAHGQTYRLVAGDGTIHYTNAPTDPSYQRLGIGVRPAVRPAVLTSSDEPSGLFRTVQEAAERYAVPERLILAVIRAESGFNPYAVSPKGARGLMQLMPQTANMLGVKNSFDPAENIDGGVRHLRGLIDRFGNDVRLAVAAYNAGEQAVTYYRGVPPYAETQGYVQKVLALFNRTTLPTSAAGASAPLPTPTYRLIHGDGTVVYTNVVPPRR